MRNINYLLILLLVIAIFGIVEGVKISGTGDYINATYLNGTNITATSNFLGNLNWSYIQNSPSYSLISDLVTLVGNWSSDKSSYLNSTEVYNLNSSWNYTTDTNTNANTICSGGTTYLDGEGNCDDISDVYINEAGDSTGDLTSDLNIDSNTLVVDYDTNEVGIGIANPLARLHVYYPTTGDVIFQAGTGDGGSDMDMKYGYNGYGWYYTYLGSGSGDGNQWQLWSEGAGATDMQVYGIMQSGNIQFMKMLSLNAGTSVNDIDITVANDDNALITSGGVYDGLASQDACSEITGCVENAVTGSGNAGKITKWNSSSAIEDSIISESGNDITIAGNTLTLGTDGVNANRTQTIWAENGYEAILKFMETPVYGMGLRYNANDDILYWDRYINSSTPTGSNMGYRWDGKTIFEGNTLVVDVPDSRVGINDDTPDYTLDVSGTLRATGIIRTTDWTNVSITESQVSDADWWDADGDISADEISESKINFVTACGAGNHYYLNGNDLACEADDDTTYTAGGGITLTGTEFNHTDTSSQASSDNSGRTYIQDIILDTYGHITSLVTATETVTDTDTQDLSYNTTTDVISLVDGGSIDITEVDTSANTICSGGTTYLDGEGNCDDISSVYEVQLDNEAGLYAVLSDVTEFIETNDAGTLVTLDTGQGANELYDMNQNVLTTSNVQFQNVTFDILKGETDPTNISIKQNSTCITLWAGTTSFSVCE